MTLGKFPSLSMFHFLHLKNGAGDDGDDGDGDGKDDDDDDIIYILGLFNDHMT